MTLLELVRHEKAMRKIFGKAELRIIEKQILGVNLSASEKTRLSRDIRPKFDIISTLSDFKKEFNLKKSQEINFLINEAKEIIANSNYAKRVKKIIVFGSFMDNELRLDSDIDIAVEVDKIDVKEATKFRIEMSPKLSEKIDLQVLNILPEKLKEEINKKGKVIYERGKDEYNTR
ncbi:MAG: nucleotidyltransferase domain-containing protein [Candidatus Pacearchaeota archaeon]|jgi:predicted nucleotidyltransferase